MHRAVVAGLARGLHNLRYSYLFLPGLIGLGLAGLAVGLTSLDRSGGEDGILALFPGGPPAARAVLATTAGAVATVAGVSFSITILSLQLVSQQFTPRALRGFLGDRLNQTVAGVFIGVFLYCLVALRTIEEGDRSFVPGLTMSVAVALAFLALALLLVFVHHMGHSIQVSNIAQGIGEATLAAIAQSVPGRRGGPADEPDPDRLVARWETASHPTLAYPAGPGFVQSIDDLANGVSGDSVRIEVLVAPGDFVTERHPIARVWRTGVSDDAVNAVVRAISIAAERDLKQDVGYGLRQLADIAVKALSPSINDPTTATTCIGYLQAILERAAASPPAPRVRRSADHDVTVVMRSDRFPDYLEALIQVGRYAAADARPVDALLRAALRVAQAADQAGAPAHARAASDAADRIARRALASGALDDEEREQVAELLAQFTSWNRDPADDRRAGSLSGRRSA